MLEKILPDSGLYCVFIADNKRHKFFDGLDDAKAFMFDRDAKGKTVYIAQATFKDDERSQANAMAVRSFWLDIDCGEKKPYPTQLDGFKALRDFCAAASFPMPYVVNSGNGLYAHWPLTEDVDPGQWKTAARLFKQVNAAFDFHVDTMRTSDSASILRIPGTHNRKDDECKPVKLIYDKDVTPIPFESFVALVEAAAKKKKLKAELTSPPKHNSDINAEFQIYDNTTPTADATLIADKCQQIDIMRKTQGDIEEPLWYSCIGVLRHTVQAPQIIHDWSCGHSEYTAEETDKKIEQHTKPPTTCGHFGDLNPRGCLGCAYKNKIKSPIVLGRIIQAIEAAAGVEPPEPFVRATDGLYAPVEDVNVCFYKHDLYIDNVAFDQSVGCEVVNVKHHLPQEGWMEFMLRTSALTDVRSAMKELYDNHVTVVGTKEKKTMVAYLECYADKLKRETKIKQLLCQMGWHERENKPLEFVLGQKAFQTDGTVEPISLAKNVPESAQSFHAKGELPLWVDTTSALGEPGMEAHAFAFLATAFGAPLMRFTGYAGAMVSMLGPSGSGKTLVGSWALSVYGSPKGLIMTADDTRTALIGRLGVYNTLPLYIDEVTNMEPKSLSELTYRITQGRDRARYTKDAIETRNINQWNTLALVSSNSSLIDRLSSAKLDAGAEINRVFEFNVDHNEALNRESATRIYRAIHENYGLAGQEYLRYLAQHVSDHRDQIDKIVTMLDEKTKATTEERFWSAVGGCAIYGGLIAKKLGIIEFDMAPIMKWLVNVFGGMRETKDVANIDAVGILGKYLDEHAANTLVIGPKGVISEPRGALHIRTESGPQKSYISRTHFRNWVNKEFGSYSMVKAQLVRMGALLDTQARKTLGADTSFSGVQQFCWLIDLGCPGLGNVVARVVSNKIKEGLKDVVQG